MIDPGSVALLGRLLEVGTKIREASRVRAVAARALLLEVAHNAAVLQAIRLDENSGDPRFMDAIAALSIDAHEVFLALALGEDDVIAIRAISKSDAAPKPRAPKADPEIPIEIDQSTEDDLRAAMIEAKTGAPIKVSQAVSYVATQVRATRTLLGCRDRLGELMRDLDVGVRARNIFAVEGAVRASLERKHAAIVPKAGKARKKPKASART